MCDVSLCISNVYVDMDVCGSMSMVGLHRNAIKYDKLYLNRMPYQIRTRYNDIYIKLWILKRKQHTHIRLL